MKRGLNWMQKIRTKAVILLLGKKIDLWLYHKKDDHNEDCVGIVEQYSGTYYGIWKINVHNNGGLIEATFRRF